VTYAINIADLTELKRHPEHAALLMVLQEHIDFCPDHAIECERRKVVGIGHGAPIVCPDEQAKALISLIRRRLKKYKLRIYQYVKARWVRV
jgi:hypothetical protein